MNRHRQQSLAWLKGKCPDHVLVIKALKCQLANPIRKKYYFRQVLERRVWKTRTQHASCECDTAAAISHRDGRSSVNKVEVSGELSSTAGIGGSHCPETSLPAIE